MQAIPLGGQQVSRIHLVRLSEGRARPIDVLKANLEEFTSIIEIEIISKGNLLQKPNLGIIKFLR